MRRSIPALLGLSLVLACNSGGGSGDEVASSSSSSGESGTTQEGEESASSEASSSSESSGSSDSSGSDSSGSDSSDSDSSDSSGSDSSGSDSSGSDSSESDTTSESTTGEPLPPSDIEVIITADNAYGFGYGTVDEVVNYYGGIENTTAGQIFNCGEGPELYEIPGEVAADATHLYIVAWADSSTTQGVLGRFRKLEGGGGGGGFGDFVLTGDAGWEVCATGIDYQPGSGGPPLVQVNQLIGSCNLDDLSPQTTSVGWVDQVGTQFGAVAVGEDNTTPYNGGPMAGNEFPLTCPMTMPAEARWMWFNWDPANVVWPQQSPFLWPGGGGNPDHQFLIFRLAADLLPEPQ